MSFNFLEIDINGIIGYVLFYFLLTSFLLFFKNSDDFVISLFLRLTSSARLLRHPPGQERTAPSAPLECWFFSSRCALGHHLTGYPQRSGLQQQIVVTSPSRWVRNQYLSPLPEGLLQDAIQVSARCQSCLKPQPWGDLPQAHWRACWAEELSSLLVVSWRRPSGVHHVSLTGTGESKRGKQKRSQSLLIS